MSDMTLDEALYTTRAMRRVRPDPIPDDVQARILDAAIRAAREVDGVRSVMLDFGGQYAWWNADPDRRGVRVDVADPDRRDRVHPTGAPEKPERTRGYGRP